MSTPITVVIVMVMIGAGEQHRDGGGAADDDYHHHEQQQQREDGESLVIPPPTALNVFYRGLDRLSVDISVRWILLVLPLQSADSRFGRFLVL